MWWPSCRWRSSCCMILIVWPWLPVWPWLWGLHEHVCVPQKEELSWASLRDFCSQPTGWAVSLASRPLMGCTQRRSEQVRVPWAWERGTPGRSWVVLSAGEEAGERVSTGGLGSVAVEGPETGGSSQEALGVRVCKRRGKSRRGQSGVSLMPGEKWSSRERIHGRGGRTKLRNGSTGCSVDPGCPKRISHV